MRQVLRVGRRQGLEPPHALLQPQRLGFGLLLLLGLGIRAVALVDAGEEEGGARREEAEEGAEPFYFIFMVNICQSGLELEVCTCIFIYIYIICV